MITSKRSVKRAVAGASAGLLVLSGIAAVANSASAVENFQFERLAGTDRYGTAADIARESYLNGVGTVLIAGGGERNFPDALAGNYLAGALDAPILLTPNNSLAEATRGAITSLRATRAVILGGTAAVSPNVEAQLRAMNLTVTREAGVDRYQTAVEIAEAAPATQIGQLEGRGRTAILASGETFADALTAGPLSFAARVPVLLTGSGGLSSATATALDDLNIQHVLVAGGTARISNAAVASAEENGTRTSRRLAGQTRELTAVEIANYARQNANFVNTHVDLATGATFADALAGGPHSGRLRAPILLTTNASTLGSAARGYLEANCGTLLEGHIFGGTAAVNDAVKADATDAAQCAATPPSTSPTTQPSATPTASTSPSATPSATVSPSPSTPPSNQDFVITPATTQSKVASTDATTNEGRTAFTVTGLNDARTYDVVLFPCDNVTTDANGVVTFEDDENTTGDTSVLEGNGTADDIGTSESGAATIESVNNQTGGPASDVVPVNGTITFTVDSVQADCAVAVLFDDTADDNDIDLNAANQPLEAFVASGDLIFTPRTAESDYFSNAVVTSTDEASNRFTATTEGDVIPDRVFSYDGNDQFFIPGQSGAASLAQFESALTSGDEIEIDYNADPAGVSYFWYDTNTTPKPTAVTANVTNADGDATADDVVINFTPGGDTPSGTTYTIQRYTVTANGDGTCPTAVIGTNTAGPTAVTDTTNTDATATDEDLAPGCYAYTVTATSPNQGTPATSAVSNTVRVVAAASADTTAPDLTSATANEVNDGTGSTSQVRYNFNEAVAVIDVTKFTVTSGGVTFQGTSATITGNTVIVTVNGTLNDAATDNTYTAAVAAAAVEDAAGNDNAADSVTFVY